MFLEDSEYSQSVYKMRKLKNELMKSGVITSVRVVKALNKIQSRRKRAIMNFMHNLRVCDEDGFPIYYQSKSKCEDNK